MEEEYSALTMELVQAALIQTPTDDMFGVSLGVGLSPPCRQRGTINLMLVGLLALTRLCWMRDDALRTAMRVSIGNVRNHSIMIRRVCL